MAGPWSNAIFIPGCCVHIFVGLLPVTQAERPLHRATPAAEFDSPRLFLGLVFGGFGLGLSRARSDSETNSTTARRHCFRSACLPILSEPRSSPAIFCPHARVAAVGGEEGVGGGGDSKKSKCKCLAPSNCFCIKQRALHVSLH